MTMDTLRRRLSIRGPKAGMAVDAAKASNEKRHRFDLEVRDLSLDVNPTTWGAFQPNAVVVRVSRRRTAAETSQAKWEASLKSPFNGFCFWEPPVNTTWRVSQPKKARDGSGGLRSKDVVVAVFNVDRKGRRKLLAKNRFNLIDHRRSGGDVENVVEGEGKPKPGSSSPVKSLRFKLYPESKKIVKCSVNLTVSHGEKNKPEPGTVVDPTLIALEENDIDDNESDRSSISRRSSIALVKPSSNLSAASASSLSASSSQRVAAPLTAVNAAPPSPPPVTAAAVAAAAPPKPASPEPKSPATSPRKELSSLPTYTTKSPEKVRSPTVQLLHDIFKDDDSERVPKPVSSPGRKPPPLPPRQQQAPKAEEEDDTVEKKPVNGNEKLEVATPAASAAANDEPEAAAVASGPSSLSPPRTPSPVAPTRKMSLRLEVAVKKTPDPTPDRSNNRRLKAMTPVSPTSKAEKSKEELIRWAKFRLEKYTQIKITNLSSSWRNGLGFCSLIHTAYPELIPLSQLRAYNDQVNCALAFTASKLIDVDMSPPLAEKIEEVKLDPSVVAVYLERLRPRLESKKDFSDEELKTWRKSCFEQFGLWQEEFSVMSPVDRPKSIVQSPLPTAAASSASFVRQKSSPSEAADRPKSIVLTDSPRQNRKRVKELIAQAHQASLEESTASESPAPSEDVTLASAMTASATMDEIAAELAQLEQEAERITAEENILHRFLREDDSDDKMALDRLLTLVNEKNALVRRQMQLNILEKEASISRRHQAIMTELQKISEIDDDHKTEAVRNREEELLEEMVKLVNEKNELVHHLDTQEKAIDEDEDIKASLEDSSRLMAAAAANKDECCIQ